jgi:hypothetical protein
MREVPDEVDFEKWVVDLDRDSALVVTVVGLFVDHETEEVDPDVEMEVWADIDFDYVEAFDLDRDILDTDFVLVREEVPDDFDLFLERQVALDKGIPPLEPQALVHQIDLNCF